MLPVRLPSGLRTRHQSYERSPAVNDSSTRLSLTRFENLPRATSFQGPPGRKTHITIGDSDNEGGSPPFAAAANVREIAVTPHQRMPGAMGGLTSAFCRTVLSAERRGGGVGQQRAVRWHRRSARLVAWMDIVMRRTATLETPTPKHRES